MAYQQTKLKWYQDAYGNWTSQPSSDTEYAVIKTHNEAHIYSLYKEYDCDRFYKLFVYLNEDGTEFNYERIYKSAPSIEAAKELCQAHFNLRHFK